MKKGYFLQYILIIIGTILYFWANVQRTAIPGAIFDVLQSDLRVGAASITALGASFMYIYALSQLIVGILITKYGGFRVISFGTVIFTAGSLLFPFAKSLWLLYISRALVGLGSAAFYLGIIQETRKSVSKNNFGIVLSLILLGGYLGGIVANAPLVIFVEKTSWRYVFIVTGLIILLLSVLYLFLKLFVKNQEVDKTIHIDLSVFKNILSKKGNRFLYYFGVINYAIYYVLQTVIGKKFLEDFCQIPTIKAAVILSLMGGLYAISGPVIASLSKILLNRRTLFLRLAAINTTISMLIIFLCIVFNIRTELIAVLFCIIAFLASLSPLLVPLLHDINKQKESGSAVSIMTASFYIGVAVLGNFIGVILNHLGYISTDNGVIIYSSLAYMAVFIMLGAISLFALYSVFHIKESEKTLRFLQMCHYMEDKYGAHWHDKYEHDLYSNV